jgi:4'-phosphopantetheinyl transferase
MTVAGNVQVWVADVAAEQPLVASLHTAAEREQAELAPSPAERATFLGRRDVLRTVLADIVGQPLGELEIERRCACCNRFHPARLMADGHSLWWSASSSGSTLVIATASHPIGVDLEPADGHLGWREVANRFFRPAESSATTSEARFVAYWTLKEAFLKALGVGLVGGLDAVDCTLLVPDSDGWLRSHEHPTWSFRSLEADTDLAMAVAVQGTPAGLVVRSFGDELELA